MTLAALLTGGCGTAAAQVRATRAAPARRVAAGVSIGGRPLGGLTVDALRTAVSALAATIDVAPVDARVDPATRGLVPGTDGTRLDVPATVARALAARPGTAVAPVTGAVPPAVSVGQLPPAPIYNGSRTRPAVAFVINIAWGESHLAAMLTALRSARAEATFCLVGRWAERHPDEVRAIEAAAWAPGAFTFCNHGYRDQGWNDLSETQAREQIALADTAIEALTGTKPLYFSPHRGEWTPAVLRASRAEGHELILWSLDTIDWRNPPADAMLERIVTRCKPGDIVLMHPTAPTAQALAGMIAGVRAKGLRLVTLDRLLSARAL